MNDTLLNRIQPDLRQAALQVAERLRRGGFLALFAGGAVRDALLGRPVSDVDVATDASPEAVEALFEKTFPVGKQFGVVIVAEGGQHLEVTTFRREAEYLDGRRPSRLSFASNPAQDALRRDFTVNALFLDPLSGEILDFVDGRRDLDAGILRTVGDPSLRFQEDKLRVIRAIRFACRLRFEIDPETWRAIRRFAAQLQQVSWERIRDELLKILTGEDPARGLDLMLESGVLKTILPEVAAMEGVAQPPEFHPEGDVYTHTRLMFSLAGELNPTLALGLLLHDVGKPPTFQVRDRIRFDGHAELGAEMTRDICRRLRLSNEQTELVVELVRRHLRFMNVQEMRESTLKRFLRTPHFDQHLELHRLDCLASHGDLTAWRFCVEKLEELGREQMRPAPLLNGHDLIDAGLTPGPVFSEILGELEDLQLEGKMESREQALQWLRQRAEGSQAE